MIRQSAFLASASLLILAGPVRAAPTAGQVDEVVVSGAPYAVSLDSVTTHVEVLTRSELDNLPAAGLGDTLASVPGLRSSAYAPGASRPVVRGLAGPRVLVLENGLGLVDASTLSPDHAVASDPGQASRIEVLRGPSALAYGGSAVGGVINVIDDRIASKPLRGVQGRGTAALSSVDRGGSVSAGVKAGAGPWVAAVDAVRRRSDDYRVGDSPISELLAKRDGVTPDPFRQVANSAVEVDGYGAGLSYVLSDRFLGGSVKKTETTYGIPYPVVLSPPAPAGEGPIEIHLNQTRWDLRGESPVPFGPFVRARVALGGADYEHAELLRNTGEVGTRFRSQGAEGRLELIQDEANGHQGAVGLQGLTRDLEAIGDEAFVPPVNIREIGLFTLQRWERGRFGVDAGLRADRRELDSAAGKRAFDNLSASAGVSFRPAAPWFVAVSLSYNGRAPTEFELFANGPHPGTGGFEIGDASLDSEKATSAEFALRYMSGPLRLEAHAFFAHYDGYIEEAPDGQFEDGLPVFRYFQTDADFHGVEFEGAVDLWRKGAFGLVAELDADYVRGRTDAGAPARIPPYSVTGRLVWTAAAAAFTAEVRHVGAQDRIAAFELPTAAYTLVNLRGELRPLGQDGARLFVDARNLTDAEAREHVSFLKDVAPLPGRAVRVGVAYSF